MHEEKQYLEYMQKVIDKGKEVVNRTGTNTYRFRSVNMNFDIKKSFPLLTTKKVWFKGILGELIWMLKGDTNIKFLVDNNINIWNSDAYRFYKNTLEGKSKSIDQEKYIWLIRNDLEFAKKYGSLGDIYGKQWRSWGDKKIDQIKKLINDIRDNPYSRRNILSAWNVSDINNMGLPPCHYSAIFSVDDNKYLNCGVTLRSNDAFLGCPYNIAQYALLTYFMAHWTGFEPGELDYWAYDFHLYKNHINAAKKQLKREPFKFPTLEFKKSFSIEDVEKITNVNDFFKEYLSIINYKHHPVIRAELVT